MTIRFIKNLIIAQHTDAYGVLLVVAGLQYQLIQSAHLTLLTRFGIFPVAERAVSASSAARVPVAAKTEQSLMSERILPMPFA